MKKMLKEDLTKVIYHHVYYHTKMIVLKDLKVMSEPFELTSRDEEEHRVARTTVVKSDKTHR